MPPARGEGRSFVPRCPVISEVLAGGKSGCYQYCGASCERNFHERNRTIMKSNPVCLSYLASSNLRMGETWLLYSPFSTAVEPKAHGGGNGGGMDHATSPRIVEPWWYTWLFPGFAWLSLMSLTHEGNLKLFFFDCRKPASPQPEPGLIGTLKQSK